MNTEVFSWYVRTGLWKLLLLTVIVGGGIVAIT
jgi:hypothetical protein